MNAGFQSEKTLESYLGFLIDHDLLHVFADLPINRCSEENKSSFTRQNPKDVKNINLLTSALRSTSPRASSLGSEATRQKTIDDLASIKTLEDFYTCLEQKLDNSLKSESKNRIICGYGNLKPELLVISDLPSEEDVLNKRILCGPSGQLLHTAIKAAGFEDNTYISPCLFWRPLGGRPLSVWELSQNAPILEALIRIIEPKAVLILGSLAANLMLNVEQTLTRIRGKIIAFHPKTSTYTIPAMVSFPPAFIIQQGATKSLFWRDLLTLKANLHK